MSMKTKAAIVISSAAVLLFMAVGGLDGVRASNNDGSYRQLQVYSEVLSRVRSEYVEEPNIPAVTDGALHGLLESLDSNSSYLTAAEFKAFKPAISLKPSRARVRAKCRSRKSTIFCRVNLART